VPNSKSLGIVGSVRVIALMPLEWDGSYARQIS
jgi:hypothetical protein